VAVAPSLDGRTHCSSYASAFPAAALKTYFIVHVATERAVRLRRTVAWRTADNGKNRRVDPADARVLVIVPAGLQLYDWEHVRVGLLHAVEVMQQISHCAAAGLRRRRECKQLAGIAALEHEIIEVLPRIIRLAVKPRLPID
jgi:hypothetical protein